MNRIIKSLFFLLISISFMFPDEAEKNQYIKRTILILPFQNKNNIAEYNYLSDVLMETLRVELVEQNRFNFTNYTEANEAVRDLKKNNINIMDFNIIRKIAYDLSTDVIINGQYIISENNLMIMMQAIDIINGDLVATTKVQGELGVNIFNLINNASNDLTNKIINKLKSVTKEEYEYTFRKISNIKFLNLLGLPAYKKAGISLTITGGILLLIGTPILIYDLAGYSKLLLEKKAAYQEFKKNTDHEVYTQFYITFIALFCVSLTATVFGAIMLSVGLPLSIINIKSKNSSVKVEINNNYSAVFYSFKFK